MKISLPIKLALFSFLSAIICTIGNAIINLEVISYISQGAWFLAYLSITIWFCKLLYRKTRYSTNITTLIISFSMAIYFGFAFSFTSENSISYIYTLLLYLFAIICIISAIVLIGRIIFYSPTSKEENVTAPVVSQDDLHSTPILWVCSCGNQNTGKFCSACGAANNNADTVSN